MTHADASPAVRTWLNFPAIPQLRPPGMKAPVWRQSAASWNALRAVAERLRYAASNVPAPLYAFRIPALPAGWQVSAPTDLERLGGKIASGSWSAGPADDPGALSVSVWPASAWLGRGRLDDPTARLRAQAVSGRRGTEPVNGVLLPKSAKGTR